MTIVANDLIKGACAVLLIGVSAYLFTGFPSFPDYRHERVNEHAVERQEKVEDRTAFIAQAKVSLEGLRTCYKDAEEQYSRTWARACRVENKDKINECILAKVPEQVCRQKIVLDENCELSGHRADMVQKYENDAKSECRLMLQFAMDPFERKM